MSDQLSDEVQSLKKSRHAIILAHHFQEAEIQEVADSIGDSLSLAQAAREFAGEIIAFCGAKFMAETAKVLNPEKTVVLPDKNAGCSLVDSCPVAAVQLHRKRNPDYVIVSYLNTSVEVKAESDILCTAGNAVDVVNSIPAGRPILFLPDVNLGNWVKQKTGRKNMTIWQGACIVHATFSARRLVAAKAEHPQARVAAHPDCPEAITRQADFVGSTSAIIDWCAEQSAEEFIIVVESGVRYSLEKRAPGKRFYFVANENCNCSECPYTRLNTLEKLRDCLRTVEPRLEIPADIMARARLPLERMLAVT